MTKNEIAKQITTELSGLYRTIRTNWELGYAEGDIITIENAESWTTGGDFSVGNDCPVEYQFEIENYCPVHEVDYSNVEELNILGAEDFESENEVLISAGAKFLVTRGEKKLIWKN